MVCGKAISDTPETITIVPFFAVFSRRAAEPLPKHLSKITAGSKPAAIGNLSNRFSRFHQHLAGLLQSVASHIFQRAHVKIFLKQAETDPLADMGRFCQLLHGNRPLIVLMDISHQDFDLAIRAFPMVLLRQSRLNQREQFQLDSAQGIPQCKFISPVLAGNFKGLLYLCQDLFLCRVSGVEGNHFNQWRGCQG